MTDWSALAAKYAKENNLSVLLVLAIINTESSGNPWATRFEPKWRYCTTTGLFAMKLGITEATERNFQMISWGLMQVMGAVAREVGYRDHLHKLCDPGLGVEFGCRQLERLFKRYSKVEDVVSAYNQGGLVTLPGGTYKNQAYVNKVMDFLKV